MMPGKNNAAGAGNRTLSAGNPQEPDITAARAFIAALTGNSDTPVVFQTFDDNAARKKALSKGSKDPFARVTSGTIEECFGQLAKLNKQGAGIFITVQECKPGKRNNDSITSIRAIINDFDGDDAVALAEAAAAKLLPSIVVESSPGKRHLYWLTGGEFPLPEYTPFIASMVAITGADPNPKDLARVLRVPGFDHCKGERHRVRMLEDNSFVSHGKQDIADAFGIDLSAIGTKAKAKANRAARRHADPTTGTDYDALDYAINERDAKLLASALKTIDPTIRDNWIAVCGALCRSGEVGFQLFHEWSATAREDGGYVGEDDCRDTFEEMIPKAKSRYPDIFEKAKAKGWVMTGADADEAQPKMTTEQVMQALRVMPPEEALEKWADMAAHLSPAEGDHVAEEVARLFGRGLRPLKAHLKKVRAKLAADSANKVFAETNSIREMIPLNPAETTWMAKQAEAALLKAEKPGRYVMFGDMLSMVTIEPMPFTHLIDDPQGAPPPVVQIRQLDESALITKIERRCCFFKADADGINMAMPVPLSVTKHLLSSMPESEVRRRVPHIGGVLGHPIVLPSGEIVSEKGFHAGSGFFIWGSGHIDCAPYERYEAVCALDRLRDGEFLRGFEFASDLDRDIAIGGLVGAVQRRILDMAPGLLINAAMQSSGKTTLARRIHVILTGRDMPVTTVPTTEEEMVKKITTLLLSNPEVVCFDNFGDGLTFRSEIIAMLITSSQFKARLLGSNTEITLPSNTLPILTGNNIKLGSDEITRWLDCLLMPNSDRPETRSFSRPDVVTHAREIRANVLRDVIGIVAGYLTSGNTVDLGSSNGSRFPIWSRNVREPIIWAGGLDVAAAFERNSEANEQKQALQVLLTLLHRKFGDETFIASDVAALCSRNGAYREFSGEMRGGEINGAVLAEALESLLCKNPDQPKSVSHVFRANEKKRVVIEGVGQRRLKQQNSNLIRGWQLVP